MGKITRALIKYNREPNLDDRPVYHRLNLKEEEGHEDHPPPPFNMLSVIVVVLVVTVLSLLSLNTIFFIHKGQRENARLAQSVWTQEQQIKQLSGILGDRQASRQFMDRAQQTQLAMAKRDAEWQEFAKNQYTGEFFMERLQEDQNVMLEKMIQMNNTLKDLEDTVKIKEGN